MFPFKPCLNVAWLWLHSSKTGPRIRMNRGRSLHLLVASRSSCKNMLSYDYLFNTHLPLLHLSKLHVFNYTCAKRQSYLRVFPSSSTPTHLLAELVMRSCLAEIELIKTPKSHIGNDHNRIHFIQKAGSVSILALLNSSRSLSPNVSSSTWQPVNYFRMIRMYHSST